MVIIFGGTDASIAASVYGVVSALNDSLKTVILQFTDKIPAEELLIGKRKNSTVNDNAINNTGMDALLRYQSFSTLTKEHFNMCVTPVFKTTNLLDLVTAPLIEDFYKEFVTDSERISEIITVAEAVYDNVVIVIDSMDSRLAETIKKVLNTREYKAVQGIRQGERAVITDKVACNEYFLICDYNPVSFFTTKYYRKLFASANILVLPYNISFRDAYLSGDLLMFLRKNLAVDSESKKNARKEDSNAEFIMQILDVSGMLNCRKDKFVITENNYEDMCWQHKETIRAANSRRSIDGENVFIKENGCVIKKKVVTLCLDKAGDITIPDTDRISNYIYKTNSNTFDRLVNIAKRHGRSINAELNHIVNNYIHYMETNASLEKRSEFKRSSPVRKALIS